MTHMLNLKTAQPNANSGLHAIKSLSLSGPAGVEGNVPQPEE